MGDLGYPKIDLTKFISTAPVHSINGVNVDPIKLMNSVSMVSMKLNSENVEQVKNLTTEGLSKEKRVEFIQNIRNRMDSDVFELSTCNRVLYVGFEVTGEILEQSVLSATGLESAPFDRYTGIDVWRQLVKVCSGLDSFILGELQVMSQFRGSVSLHRKNGLISDLNGSFFDHVVSANRMLRKEFGFNQTTESMLNLATTAIEELISTEKNLSTIVLGFGGMGSKAVETMLDFGQTDITVVTRNPEASKERNPDIASQVQFLTFEEWNSNPGQPSLIISTIRNTEPTYNLDRPLPSVSSTVMDFSWPPSIDRSGLNGQQNLLGMEHWIKVAHKAGVEWDYSSTIQQSDVLLTGIQDKFMNALTDRTQSKFRAFIYQTLEALSNEWKASEHAGKKENQLAPFSREIATWICNQNRPFESAELEQVIRSTDRPINPALLGRVVNDVTDTILRINENSTLPEAMS
ncbi:MAG: hypothetical protein NLN65_03650 [Candidatus Poseidoniaceae archaeon]|nr:hypothetical protein [Candidatus Poseidoniaceae archaeon]